MLAVGQGRHALGLLEDGGEVRGLGDAAHLGDDADGLVGVLEKVACVTEPVGHDVVADGDAHVALEASRQVELASCPRSAS